MRNVEKAVECFTEGCNCAQAILATYGEELGLGRNEALRVVAAFGGGIARTGGLCGAVSGALMVIGLKYAKGPESKEKLIAAARDFMDRFSAISGSVMCRDLLGCDLNTPEGRAFARSSGIFDTRCPALVRQAAQLLEEMPQG